MKHFGIIGWKNSGKTTLVAGLVTELCARGYSVSTIKHAHHTFDLDQPGRDSYKHRLAGAQEVLISSDKRWALIHELQDEPEYDLAVLIEKMTPVDLVLIEGYKTAPHPKIECHRATSEKPLISESDPTIVAIASDTASSNLGLHVMDLNNIPKIADFILRHTGLKQ